MRPPPASRAARLRRTTSSSGAWRRTSSFWALYTGEANSRPIHSPDSLVGCCVSSGSSGRWSNRVGGRLGVVEGGEGRPSGGATTFTGADDHQSGVGCSEANSPE